MTLSRALQLWLLAVVTTACTGATRDATVASDTSRPPVASAATTTVSTDDRPRAEPEDRSTPGCRTPPEGIRVDSLAIAGFALDTPLAEFEGRCLGIRMVRVPMGGEPAAALRFDFAGAVVWAAQADQSDSLRWEQAADWWVIEGDSLRLRSGKLIPRTFGELRQAGGAVVVAQTNADTMGSYAILCSDPHISLLFGHDLALPANTGRWPVAQVPGNDSLRVQRVEVSVAPRDTSLVAVCRSVGT
jgi:hypothetical protein